MSEVYGNFGTSTTTGTIDNSTNPFSIPVASISSFPSAFPFRITVSNTDGSGAEVMLVTGASTGTLTATRSSGIANIAAAEVPTPALSTHSSGSIVSHNVTSGAVMQLLTERSPAFVAPVGFALHDGIGGAVLSTDLFGFTLSVPSASGNNVIFASTALATSTYTAVFGFRGIFLSNSGFAQIGPMITDGTKIETIRFKQDGGVDIYTWSNYNNPNSSPYSGTIPTWGQAGIMVKIVSDASHRTWYIGDYRRRQFIQIFQEAAGTYLTETQAGFFGLSNNGSNCLIEAFHYGIS